MAQPHIRMGCLSDRRALSHLHERAARAVGESVEAGRHAHFWDQALAPSDPRASCLIAEQRGVVFGFCALRTPDLGTGVNLRAVHIAGLYVDPSRWRMGVGTALLRESSSRLALGGWHDLSLWVFVANTPALAFYESHGFRDDGGRHFNHPTGGEARRMGRSLKA